MPNDANLLVGMDTRDDAAVYRVADDIAIVFTTDFFTPIVDDAFDFGRIAAANALSDVYAMGARPIMALNIVGFPAKELPLDLLGRILEGGSAVAQEAGIPLAGGHSIDDKEPKYGMAVVGIVHPDRFVANVGAKPGDKLVLTKPLGIGVITTAIKRGKADAATIAHVTELMATLNKAGGEAIIAHRDHVHAATDVTGFGLLGHLHEMLDGSGVGAVIDAKAVPILDVARRFAADGIAPGGSRANVAHVAPNVDFGGLNDADSLLLCDAQTSGGLLVAVEPGAVEAFVATLGRLGTPAAAVIGEIVAGPARIHVKS